MSNQEIIIGLKYVVNENRNLHAGFIGRATDFKNGMVTLKSLTVTQEAVKDDNDLIKIVPKDIVRVINVPIKDVKVYTPIPAVKSKKRMRKVYKEFIKKYL